MWREKQHLTVKGKTKGNAKLIRNKVVEVVAPLQVLQNVAILLTMALDIHASLRRDHY